MTLARTATPNSVVVVQIFDQKQFKDSPQQGFLGVVNVLVSSVITNLQHITTSKQFLSLRRLFRYRSLSVGTWQ